jgi:hypothetical protein
VSAYRIASLVPSITETLVELGLKDELVARTGFCIHPASVVSSIAKVGGTKDVNLAKLRALAPTHCIVNMDENELPTVDAIREFVPHVIVTHPLSPEDNLALFEQLGTLFNREQQAQSLCSALTIKLNEIKLATASKPERVLYLIWRTPYMTIARDTYISRMLALINWYTEPALEGGAVGAARYPVVTLTEPWMQGIDRVLLSTEPYLFNPQHISELRLLLEHPKVQLIDGEMCSWYGSRAIEGVAYLKTLTTQEAA